MKVTRASFSPQTERFIGSAHGQDGDAVQVDFHGPSARLFRRVFLPESQVVIEATDQYIMFRRIDDPQPAPAPVQEPPAPRTDATFRQHLTEET